MPKHLCRRSWLRGLHRRTHRHPHLVAGLGTAVVRDRQPERQRLVDLHVRRDEDSGGSIRPRERYRRAARLRPRIGRNGAVGVARRARQEPITPASTDWSGPASTIGAWLEDGRASRHDGKPSAFWKMHKASEAVMALSGADGWGNTSAMVCWQVSSWASPSAC